MNQVPKGYYSQLEKPKYCYWCLIEVTSDHWVKNYNVRNKNGFSWLCRVRKNSRNVNYYATRTDEQKQNRSEADKARYLKNPEYIRWKAYRSCDAKMYGGETIAFDKALKLMSEPCFFCSKPYSGGLDRKDSRLGHTETNVVGCCPVCNNIISDLPWEAKLCLKDGLRKIYLTETAKDWLPATMRKRNLN